MDKEHTRYGAGTATIARVENGFIVALRLWDNEVTLVAEDLEGVLDILQRLDWSGTPRGERLGKQILGGGATQAQRDPPTPVDEAPGLSARSLRG